MKLIRIINNESFKTYSKNKVERVSHGGKTYIASRFIDYPKTNVLTLRKQKIVIDLIRKGVDMEEIEKITGVPFKIISLWYSHSRFELMKDGDKDERQWWYSR